MKINRVKYLSGPNYYSFKPTIWIELDIEELEDKPSDAIPGFADRLIRTMPTLQSHTCSLGYPGGFVERLQRGTWVGHILEHMAIEIQCLAGIEVKRGKTISTSIRGVYHVTYNYKEEESGYYAFEAAMDIVERILNGEENFDIQPYISNTAALYYDNKLGPSTEAIYEAAKARKIPVKRIGKDSFLRIGTGSKQKSVQATISNQTSYMAVENSCDKEMTKTLLREASLPAPEGTVISSREELETAADKLGFPLVIKPLNGRQGQNVITNITTKGQLLSSFECIHQADTEYIVERYYTGDDYRFVVVNGALVAAALRVPPRVMGDGISTIRQLIEIENRNPLRGDAHEKPMTKIPFSEGVNCYLEKNGLTLETVVQKGEIVQVLGNANLSTGGMAIDVTDEVHPTYKRIAEEAAKAIGLDIAGIDIISNDIAVPFNPDIAAIIEVNAAPGIRMHHYPSFGESRDVGGAIVDYLFPTREDAAIPIVAVTGTNGKTTTARLVTHLMKQEGRRIGLTNSDGVWIDNICIDQGDCSGPGSAEKILANPNVDLAVLETARGGILRKGLAFNYCDVGIVTNVSEDHLGQDGIDTIEELRHLKRLIPEVVIPGGSCILNADDEAVAEMSAHTDGNVIYFSLDSSNSYIKKAIEQEGTAWFVDNKWIVLYDKGSLERFLPIAQIPITINGFAKHNISNALAALAASYALGQSLAELRRLILTFHPTVEQSKGRFNVFDIQGRTIVVDYAHNAAGLEAICGTIDQMKKSRVISSISAAGDRLDSDIFKLGEKLGGWSDFLVIKEDADLRGRQPMEAANLIKKGALNVGKTYRHLAIIRNEREAFFKAWEISNPGDIVLLLYDKFDNVTRFINEIKGSSTALKMVD